MKILITSDLHGDMTAYAQFSHLLKSYACGIIAGDLMDEFITKKEAVGFQLIETEEPEELMGDNEDEALVFEDKYRDAINNPGSINRRGLEIKKKQIITILNQAKKPIFYVTGNHDIADWRNHAYLKNVENGKRHFHGYTFAGIKSSFTGILSNAANLQKTQEYITKKTILISHAPPYGILDTTSIVNAAGKRSIGHIGSQDLIQLITETRPAFCVFGHVHECFGIQDIFINACWKLKRRFVELDTATGKALILDLPSNGGNIS